jgi:hypothetical protein
MGDAVINMGYEGGAIGVVVARPSLQVVGLRAFHTLTALADACHAPHGDAHATG